MKRAELTAPLSFTDQNAGAVVGIACRKSLVRTLARLACPFVKNGNRIIVLASDWEAAVRRASGVQNSAPARTALTEAQIIDLATRRGAR